MDSTFSNSQNLFVVDNGDKWTVYRYLDEWCQISQSFDIATGYFEIGALLDLDGKWQQLDKIRILMGSETTYRTKRLLIEALNTQVSTKLDSSLEEAKESNPFLHGALAIVDGLKSGKIECRVYNKEKFHAKTYITHPKLEIIGPKALVGSSNFTRPGLTQNVELNVQIQGGQDVAKLQEWFNYHWEQSEDITSEILNLIARHTRDYTPFEVYAKSLHEFFHSHNLTANEWEENTSEVFKHLDLYQKEGYWSALKIAKQYGGAFVCDGVGLGKTFIGLMLIERLILHEGKRVLLFAPKAAREGVWDFHIKKYLPHIGGVGGGVDFSDLLVFNHSDLTRKGEYPERFVNMSKLADVVIIDEAHNFRNVGSRGDVAQGRDPSRYYRLYDTLSPEIRKKTVFLLTATPINNSLSDFRHMTELFTRRDQAYFARNLGVNNLTAYFNNIERKLKKKIGIGAADLTEHINDLEDVLSSDVLFREIVVQRSRSYARESQMRENENTVVFPERMAPQVAEYSIEKSYGRLLTMIEEAFQKETPLFTLPIYYPLHWYIGKNEDIDPLEEGRQKQVVGLIRTMFLKRFESSVVSFELSCDRLMKKLLAFLEVHSSTNEEKNRLLYWKEQNAEILGYASTRQLEFWSINEEENEDDKDDDVIPPELLENVHLLNRKDYDVAEIMNETYMDLNQILKFLYESKKFDPKHDDKLQKLIQLLKSKPMENQKVLIFTEFADTARYIYRQLSDSGISGLEQLDSSSKPKRSDVIKAFAPYYNGTTSKELLKNGINETRILITTDVLSEGLNLQDASRLINYDIHWNPVRLIQRIGRVDRRINSAIEESLILDHPEYKKSRGKVWFWNFLPPDELNKILSLYTRVTEKTLLISKTLGIEERKLLTPDDDYDPLKEFNEIYEGTKTTNEEMLLEYQELIKSDDKLEGRLINFPSSIFSGRKRVSNRVQGVFFCYALPGLDKETGEFTESAGTTRWYLYDMTSAEIIDEPRQIISSIRTKFSTPRICTTDPSTLIEVRDRVLTYIKNTYLKRVDAPVGVKPVLKCWMELNDGS